MTGMVTRRGFVSRLLCGSLGAIGWASRATACNGLAGMLEKASHAGSAPGYAAFVGRRDHSWTYATGVQDLTDRAPMRPDTIFRVASITKPVVAAAAMALVDDRWLALDDPIDRWIPELANRRVVRSLSGAIDDCVPASRRITLHDLLTLQMGIGALFADPVNCPFVRAFHERGIAPGPALFSGSSQDFIDRLASLPLACHPGQRWLYHTGMEVAGVLVSRVSGKALSAFVEERLSGPLGMADTAFFVPLAKQRRLATSYIRLPDGTLAVHDQAMGGRLERPPAMESGGGGLASTAADFGQFGRMLLGNGRYKGKRILSERTARLMRTDQISAAVKARSPFFPGFWESYGWGLGAAVSTRVDSISKSGRYGWWGGTGTTFFIDPGSDTAAVLLSQRLMTGPDDTPVSDAFLRAAFQGTFSRD